MFPDNLNQYHACDHQYQFINYLHIVWRIISEFSQNLNNGN